MNNILSGLKQLHDKGMDLIYLHERDKNPIGNNWQSRPRKTWEEMELSFEKRYNVGVRLGEWSRLISGKYLGAIDCDVKSLSRSAKLEMNEKLRELGIDLKHAPTVMSGRGNGSKHIYVQTVVPIKPMKFAQSEKTVKVLMPGAKTPHSKREMRLLSDEDRKQGYRLRPAWEIAFMGTGQQTVLPPSVHPDTGARYAWANPLSVKTLPAFDASKFVSQTQKKMEERALDFKAIEVNLYESDLPVRIIKLIEDGKGSEDRSADLFKCALAMCRLPFTDNEILSVLSDTENFISSAAYDHTQSQSRARAVKWLHRYTLTKARYETDPARKFENKPVGRKPLTKGKAEKLSESLVEDRAHIIPDRDGHGKPKPTLRNVVHILENEMGGGLVGYNEFSNRVVFLKNTIYGGVKGKELLDTDDLHLKVYIANHFGFEPSKELCYEAHTVVCKKYSFHPVKEYLQSLSWDGEARLDTWLEVGFQGKGPRSYIRAVARKTLVAAVKRIYEPGCKFDHMTVLEGFQGKGKSTALRVLASDKWFTDDIRDLHNKDVVDQMVGKWIVEMGELSAIKGREKEFTKAFISRQVDRVRLAYGRRSADFPRSCIFVGTTNDTEYLTDESGNRRFWPVSVSQVDFDWLKDNRDQLWAEAIHYYEGGEEIYMDTPELELLATREQAKRFMSDELQAKVMKYLDSNEADKSKLTSTHIWQHVEDAFGANPTQAEASRIGRIMRHLGYQRKSVRVDESVFKSWVKL